MAAAFLAPADTNVIPLREIDRIVDNALYPRTKPAYTDGLILGKPHVRRYRGCWCTSPMRDCPFPREFGDSPVEAFNRFNARYAVLVFG